MNSKIDNILNKYGIHGSNLEKVASDDDVIVKAKELQEKLAQALENEDEVHVEKIASGLTPEEHYIIKFANLV